MRCGGWGVTQFETISAYRGADASAVPPPSLSICGEPATTPPASSSSPTSGADTTSRSSALASSTSPPPSSASASAPPDAFAFWTRKSPIDHWRPTAVSATLTCVCCVALTAATSAYANRQRGGNTARKSEEISSTDRKAKGSSGASAGRVAAR